MASRDPDQADETRALLAQCGVRHLSEVSTDPPPPMLLKRLDPVGHTILYGPGGVGKGVLAAWWITKLVKGGLTVLIVDYEGHDTEWSRRIRSLGGPEVTAGVLYVAPATPRWTGARGPIWTQAQDLRTIADQLRADYVVIDSIVAAVVGMDPTKPETASQYEAALHVIGRPSLSLAHVTKGDDVRYPFGSVFFHNFARTTWSLIPVRGRGTHTVVLTHRKRNNYADLGRSEITVGWHHGLPTLVREDRYSPSLAEQIKLVLDAADEGMTAAEIIAVLKDRFDDPAEEVKPDSVRSVLRRGSSVTPPRFAAFGEGRNARWRNV